MSFTKVEANPSLKTEGTIRIMPYFDKEVENMGLESYGMSLHEGVLHTEQLACLEMNGIKRYLTGLNEFAPEVKLIKDEKERAAKVKEIRSMVAQLERDLAANVLDITDKNFWNKVVLLRPDNDEFWGKINISAGNQAIPLNPQEDPYDLIKLCAIYAGGFTLIAKSFKQATDMAVPPKFFLDRKEDTTALKNAYRKVKNKAFAALQELFDQDSTKLLYVTKVVEVSSPQYTKTTSNETLYDAMDLYISAVGSKDKKRAAQTFLNTSKLSVGDLKLRAMIKDAVFYKELVTKGDGQIYHASTGVTVGKNVEEVLEFLKNPLNEDTTSALQQFVEYEWNK